MVSWSSPPPPSPTGRQGTPPCSKTLVRGQAEHHHVPRHGGPHRSFPVEIRGLAPAQPGLGPDDLHFHHSRSRYFSEKIGAGRLSELPPNLQVILQVVPEHHPDADGFPFCLPPRQVPVEREDGPLRLGLLVLPHRRPEDALLKKGNELRNTSLPTRRTLSASPFPVFPCMREGCPGKRWRTRRLRLLSRQGPG